MSKNKEVDHYIAASADFAKPVLNHLRKLVHIACPQVEEKIKWGFPHFDYKGMMCNMAAFKNHCAFGYWKAALMKDAKTFENNRANSMGHAGKIKSLADLPEDSVIISQVKEAMALNDSGTKLPERKKRHEEPEIILPEILSAALAKSKKALATFESFSSSQKREYINWINEAKTGATKEKRTQTTIEWLSEGKTRNWKYATK